MVKLEASRDSSYDYPTLPGLHLCLSTSRLLLRTGEGFTVSHAVAGADNVVEQDKLGEGQRIALALLAADGKVAKLVEAIRA